MNPSGTIWNSFGAIGNSKAFGKTKLLILTGVPERQTHELSHPMTLCATKFSTACFIESFLVGEWGRHS